MKICVPESIAFTNEQRKRLESLGKVTYFEDMPSGEVLAKRCEGFDIIALDWAPIDIAIPLMKKGVKLVSLPYTGVGFIPLKEASNKGIKIANAPGYSTEAVAEFSIGLMISLVRRINKYAQEIETITTSTLYNKKILILGAGNIGKRVGQIAESLGMLVNYYKRKDNLHKMLSNADIVFCSLPLTEETRGLIGKKEFESMKDKCYFVSIAHNEIFDLKALETALGKKLAGAAIDLAAINVGDYKSESWKVLKNNPKVLLTPHVAYKTDQAIERGHEIQIDNIESFIKGKPINIVN